MGLGVWDLQGSREGLGACGSSSSSSLQPAGPFVLPKLPGAYAGEGFEVSFCTEVLATLADLSFQLHSLGHTERDM